MGIFKSLGRVLGGAAKFASVIPGVGTVAGAALGGAGGLLSGGGVKGMLGGGAMGAAGPLAGKLLGGAGAAAGLGGKLTGKGIAGHLLKNAPTILGGLGAAQGASQVSRGNKLQDQATQMKMQEYAALGPVRQRAIAQALMGAPQGPTLGGIYRDPTNPFSRNG